MSDIERSMFDYWLDQYEATNGEPAPLEVAATFERMVRLDEAEMAEPIGEEAE